MFVEGSHTYIFAMIYTSIETSPNVCKGKPCICREPACIVELHLAMLVLYTVMGWFPDIFFSVALACYQLSSYTLSRKKTNK